MPKQQKAFDKMKALLATDAVSVCPDHNLGFNVEADASDCQLGAVINSSGHHERNFLRCLGNNMLDTSGSQDLSTDLGVFHLPTKTFLELLFFFQCKKSVCCTRE